MRQVTAWPGARVCGCVGLALSVLVSSTMAQDGAGVATVSAGAADVWSKVPVSVRAALDTLTADGLRGDLSFISDDLLAGRGTPSPGLEIAAHYIAAQFRGAGLEPLGDDGYFQTADLQLEVRHASDFSGSVTIHGKSFSLGYDQVSIQTGDEVHASGAPLVRIASTDPDAIDGIDPATLSGAVVLTDLADFRTVPRDQQGSVFVAMQRVLPKLDAAGVVAVISIDRNSKTGRGFGDGQLINPERDNPRRRGFGSGPPLMWTQSPDLVQAFDSLENAQVVGKADLDLGPTHTEPAGLKNVIGMLPGRDPVLRDQYVIVTAHYDHVGTGAPVDGDGIYNGANDDGSGTVSVIALARTLGRLPEADRPARSILFMTVFGEERGLLGSEYYVNHPVKPLADTVADLNLEQVGRTDELNDKPQIRRASLTGFGYTTMSDAFVEAGQATGIEVFEHARYSAAFFLRSDNAAFARAGVPSHTLCVAYQFPDYHGVGDHWDKIDYENMCQVNRMAALGLYLIADADRTPTWNAQNPDVARYEQAWKRLQAQSEP